MRNRRLHPLLMIVTYLFSSLTSHTTHDTEVVAHSFITLDGKRTKVLFNDADTFKILNGAAAGKSVRVAGFNALENYGPVHEWAGMSALKLNEVSAVATIFARKGGWHCTTLDKSDAYGRLLSDCNDLGRALIAEGLAHAFSMDETPAKNTLLRVQRLAQKNRLGMWQGGIPNYIITSLHSAHEGKGRAYNRLISTRDGSTKLWAHSATYSACQSICLNDEPSCMVYVPYQIRYGNKRPHCLLMS